MSRSAPGYDLTADTTHILARKLAGIRLRYADQDRLARAGPGAVSRRLQVHHDAGARVIVRVRMKQAGPN